MRVGTCKAVSENAVACLEGVGADSATPLRDALLFHKMKTELSRTKSHDINTGTDTTKEERKSHQGGTTSSMPDAITVFLNSQTVRGSNGHVLPRPRPNPFGWVSFVLLKPQYV